MGGEVPETSGAILGRLVELEKLGTQILVELVVIEIHARYIYKVLEYNI